MLNVNNTAPSDSAVAEYSKNGKINSEVLKYHGIKWNLSVELLTSDNEDLVRDIPALDAKGISSSFGGDTANRWTATNGDTLEVTMLADGTAMVNGLPGWSTCATWRPL